MNHTANLLHSQGTTVLSQIEIAETRELAKFIRKKEMGVKGMDSIISDCRRKLNAKTNS